MENQAPARVACPDPDSSESDEALSSRADVDLCNDLKAYLRCRSRKVDPPAPLGEAWDHFYDIFTPRIKRSLRGSGLPGPDQEDCLQNIWRELVGQLADFHYDPTRGRLSTWLMTVVRNLTVDAIRRRRRRLTLGIDDAAALAEPQPGPGAVCERLATQVQVREVLNELSHHVSALNFQVLYQRAIAGRSNAEVAEGLGLSSEQVRFRMHRMKSKFRDLFVRMSSVNSSQRPGTVRSEKLQKTSNFAQRRGMSCEQEDTTHTSSNRE